MAVQDSTRCAQAFADVFHHPCGASDLLPPRAGNGLVGFNGNAFFWLLVAGPLLWAGAWVLVAVPAAERSGGRWSPVSCEPGSVFGAEF